MKEEWKERERKREREKERERELYFHSLRSMTTAVVGRSEIQKL